MSSASTSRRGAPRDSQGNVGPSRGISSLERKLPLMIFALVALTLVAFGFLAFTELRQSSVVAAKAQIRTMLQTTVDASARSVVQRLALLEQAAAQPAVVRALASIPQATPVAPDSVRRVQVAAVPVNAPATEAVFDSAKTALRARVARADSMALTGQFLIDAAGRRHEVLPATLGDVDLAMLDSTVASATRRDSVTIGSMYRTDSLMRYWLVAPVRSAGRTQGYLAERRQLRAAGTAEQQIKDLTGLDINVYYAGTGSQLWAALRGDAVAPRFDANVVPDSFDLVAADGEQVIGAKSAVRGIPLALIFTVRKNSVYARANAFLRRMVMVGAVLLLASILGAWLVSRRVTVPLKSLAGAAREIAGGNYATREPVRTGDEMGELALAFNSMAERIGESHTQLAIRIDESEALAQQLHHASAAKSEFLAMMSHELRTPLSAISGYAEILQLGMRGQLNEAQQLDLSRIQANQVHLLRIINDILDLAQVESGQLQVSTQPVLMSDVVNDVEPIILPLLTGREINYAVQDTVHSQVVLAERDRLTQVLVNLVANAIRFTPAGGRITVHGEEKDGRVHVHVSDTGIGIAPEKHEAIFQPFVQAEGGASRRAQGTGLGLAISRRIAEALGGTLTVQSALGHGSTFTLELLSAAGEVSAAPPAGVP